MQHLTFERKLREITVLGDLLQSCIFVQKFSKFSCDFQVAARVRTLAPPRRLTWEKYLKIFPQLMLELKLTPRRDIFAFLQT